MQLASSRKILKACMQRKLRATDLIYIYSSIYLSIFLYPWSCKVVSVNGGSTRVYDVDTNTETDFPILCFCPVLVFSIKS